MDDLLEDLRATVETLAAIDRPPCSEGEREAAEWIAARLDREGCDARVERTPAFPSYAPTHAGLSALAALGGLLARSRRPATRLAGGALAAAAGAGIVADCTNGPRVVRPLWQRRGTATSVIAQAGDRGAPRTLVVLAHHDAAPTGAIFDQSAQRWVAARFPQVIEAVDTAPPIWWPVFAGPFLAAAGALTGRRRLASVGAGLATAAAAGFADIARSPHVPGANDNLSGVAVLVGLARVLRERPVEGLRVVLVSAGAEETLQEGIRGLAPMVLDPLPRDRSWVVNVDTVGAPHLAMLEGEGCARMEDYTDPAFRDLVARCAAAAGVPLRRGLRARSSTDSVIASRTPLPTTTLVSLDDAKAQPHYHLMTDVPEHVQFPTVARAVRVVEATARALAAA